MKPLTDEERAEHMRLVTRWNHLHTAMREFLDKEFPVQVSTRSVRELEELIDEAVGKAREANRLRAACEMVLRRWTFDNHQQHTHSWHDMQDCAEVIRAALTSCESTEERNHA